MRAYTLTFVALLVLTTLTLGLSFAPLGAWHVPLALLIAFAKTALIALFFMHLIEQQTTNWLAITVALLLLTVFVGLSALDVVTRFVSTPAALSALR
jgi:cytochrome c oxidase subunit 4